MNKRAFISRYINRTNEIINDLQSNQPWVDSKEFDRKRFSLDLKNLYVMIKLITEKVEDVGKIDLDNYTIEEIIELNNQLTKIIFDECYSQKE